MSIYKVTFCHTGTYEAEIEAESREEADRMAKDVLAMPYEFNCVQVAGDSYDLVSVTLIDDADSADELEEENFDDVPF